MTALQQIEQLLTTMSVGEKAQVARWVQNDLSFQIPGIERTPGVCGGNACIVRTLIPVWQLVEAQQNGASEAQVLTSYPSLRAEDLTNAWAYYRGNKAEIDSEIVENKAVKSEITKNKPLDSGIPENDALETNKLDIEMDLYLSSAYFFNIISYYPPEL
jgi:uncharacterized protein (DUF433 family)